MTENKNKGGGEQNLTVSLIEFIQNTLNYSFLK